MAASRRFAARWEIAAERRERIVKIVIERASGIAGLKFTIAGTNSYSVIAAYIRAIAVLRAMNSVSSADCAPIRRVILTSEHI
jgi:hypothetical protein